MSSDFQLLDKKGEKWKRESAEGERLKEEKLLDVLRHMEFPISDFQGKRAKTGSAESSSTEGES